MPPGIEVGGPGGIAAAKLSGCVCVEVVAVAVVVADADADAAAVLVLGAVLDVLDEAEPQPATSAASSIPSASLGEIPCAIGRRPPAFREPQPTSGSAGSSLGAAALLGHRRSHHKK
ncbi:MAG: hypothetical protein ACLQA5_10770 [Solirubrobacteraceae bacterium]